MSKVVDYVWSRRENVLLFAAALAVSLVLFWQLQSGFDPDKQREFEVPLVFANLGDDMTVVQAPRAVRVVATGIQQTLDSLDTSRVHAVVDLREAKAGTGRFRVDVVGPLRIGLTLEAVRGFAEMNLEKKERRQVEVTLLPTGTPPESYTYDGATMLPTTVEVSGPESIVPQVRSVRAVLDLTRVSPNQTVELDLEPLGAGNRPVPLITITPDKVQVRPALAIGPSRRKLLVTPVFENQPSFGYRVTGYDVEPNQIETTGETSDVARLTTVETDTIDLSGLTSDRTFKVQLRLPNGLTSTSGETVSVTVHVRRS